MRRSAILAAAFALLLTACNGSGGEPASTTTSSPPASDLPTTTTASTAPQATTTTTTTTTTLPAPPTVPAVQLASLPRPGSMPAFAGFPEVPLRGDEPAYAGPATPTTLAGVFVAPALEDALADPGLRAALAQRGFAVVPADFLLFHQAYEIADYDPYALFVTVDAAYHAWHLTFSKALRTVEEERLLPVLEELTAGLLVRATAQREELAGTALEDSAGRVEAWLQAAATLLELDAGPVDPRAAAEVALAIEAAQLVESPITSFGPCAAGVSPANCVDYSLFKPRGHYTRSEALTRFFRAMSLYGQTGFFVDAPESLRIGTLVARLLAADAGLAEQWRAIYEPTAFLVGLADDYTPFEVAVAVEDVAPGALAEPAPLADDAVMRQVGERLVATRRVRINEEAASARVMGARFVIDSYVLDQMAWPFVGEEEERRVTVSPLDLAAALGSEFAYRVQDEAGQTAFLNYDAQLDAMRAEMAARTIEDWAATVYDAWLYALVPMWSPYGAAHPDFMRTAAWTAKAHQSGFGSYTELKHDTILFAKQGFAAEGGGDPPPFVPRHWVEPDPVAFTRLANTIGLAADGLAERDLLPDDIAGLFADLEFIAADLARLAEDELAGRPISEEDNFFLQSIGSWLEFIWIRSADLDEESGVPSLDDQEAAIVADIFRSTFAVLELGTGRVDLIYVLVPDDAGRFQVARGGVYSYYEFWRAADDGRLTDEEWRAMLAAGTAPARPAWQDAFLVR